MHNRVTPERCRVYVFGVYDPSLLTVYRCSIVFHSGRDMRSTEVQAAVLGLGVVCWVWARRSVWEKLGY